MYFSKVIEFGGGICCKRKTGFTPVCAKVEMEQGTSVHGLILCFCDCIQGGCFLINLWSRQLLNRSGEMLFCASNMAVTSHLRWSSTYIKRLRKNLQIIVQQYHQMLYPSALIFLCITRSETKLPWSNLSTVKSEALPVPVGLKTWTAALLGLLRL